MNQPNDLPKRCVHFILWPHECKECEKENKAIVDLVKHNLGRTIVHIPGEGVCDFQSLCGSSWDDGTWIEFRGLITEVTCRGCMAYLQHLLPYAEALHSVKK